jgi:hypothetical protein
VIKFSDLQGSMAELSASLQRSVKLDHLLALTDHNAVLQHAKFSVPARREGYTVDDNARALVFMSRAQGVWKNAELVELQRKLLSFMLLMQHEDGRFHNLMNFSHEISDEASVGDHLGRAIWSVGAVMNSDVRKGLRDSARLIFDKALPWARSSTSARTRAYACLGLCERLRVEPHDRNLLDNLRMLADSLVAIYRVNRTSDWKWFENVLTYDNPRLSEAMFSAYQSLKEEPYRNIAEESMQFLVNVETIDEILVPIGHRGWYVKGGDRAMYDQQPIEPGSMVEASALAHSVTGSKVYEEFVRRALGWFLGFNTKKARVYDDSTGGCFDGIGEQGLNENQGSESTLAFLLASVSLIRNFHRNRN